MPNVSLHPEADQEFKADIRWYRARGRQVARDFAADVRHVFHTVGGNPAFYGWHDAEYREAVLVRFPYSVIYRVDAAGNVLVVAVAHASRKPGYWRRRR